MTEAEAPREAQGLTRGSRVRLPGRGPAADRASVASPRVYLSYRREDAAYGRRLQQAVAEGLGAGAEVLSAASVSPGAEWQGNLEVWVSSADVLLVVLGPASSGGGGLPSGQLQEVTAVLAQGGRIIPVLVGGADLPADLDRWLGGEVARRQAVVLADSTWDRDVKQLLAAVQRAAEQPPARRPGRPAGPVVLLPEQARGFVDRAAELTSLLEFLAPVADEPTGASPRVALIVGAAGIGKSALALQAAYRLRERFPDGQLYASLDELGGEAQVLSRFLDAFGVDRHSLPESTEGLVELYQGMLAGRRVLVVLDDVPSAEGARLLLPRAGGCAALLTSRDELRQPPLTDTTNARVITLGALPTSDAIELLRKSAGSAFVDVSPQVAGELVQAVEGHPLALQLIAAQARQSGAAPLSMLAGLQALPGDQAQVVRATLLKWVYERLPDGHRRLFRLLAVLPTPEFEAGLAAALAGIEPAEADAALRSLLDSVLLERSGDGRYRLGELVAGFAGEQLAAEEPDEQRRLALDRAIRWIAARTAFQPQAPITRDYWTADDTLGYGQYADAIAAFIRHPGTRPPLTIGVKAPWGAGKTSLMRMSRSAWTRAPTARPGRPRPWSSAAARGSSWHPDARSAPTRRSPTGRCCGGQRSRRPTRREPVLGSWTSSRRPRHGCRRTRTGARPSGSTHGCTRAASRSGRGWPMRSSRRSPTGSPPATGSDSGWR